jgi:hypothetical protein
MAVIDMGPIPSIIIGKEVCFEKKEIEIKECVVSVNV